jgi:hypothetical protein
MIVSRGCSFESPIVFDHRSRKQLPINVECMFCQGLIKLVRWFLALS